MKSQNLDESSLRFLKRLKRNNTREWFDQNREEYEATIKIPVRKLVAELRPLLLSRLPHLEVSPKSVYRINRDTRFSDDKTPYKTWIGCLFWDRRFKRNEGPALYLGLDPTGIAIGGGIWRFEPLQRALFRERVTTFPSERTFADAASRAKRAGYKLLGRELDMPSGFGGHRFASQIAKLYEPCVPLMSWLASEIRVRF
ncbi:MAG: TIGR02453 family protein [Bdellovibrionales bacterium]|nr:TIGR02453 family protein [Bdellovibrionales bacterium]